MEGTDPKRRWYRPAPAWLVYVSLAVTGLLFLSERWQWFWFNEHKGWTVLIAVAALGVFLLSILAWFIGALGFRRRFQFGLRTLLTLTLTVALPFAWLADDMQKARRQHGAATRLKELGGAFSYFDFGDAYLFVEMGCTLSPPPPFPPVPDWSDAALRRRFLLRRYSRGLARFRSNSESRT